jgi:hypothetical protein
MMLLLRCRCHERKGEGGGGGGGGVVSPGESGMDSVKINAIAI